MFKPLKLYIRIFIMQVLLPDFALSKTYEKGIPFKNSKKLINTKRTKTMEYKRNFASKSQRTMTIEKAENTNLHHNTSQYQTLPFNSFALQSFAFKQHNNFDFFDSTQNPIHTKKTSKFIQGLMNKGKLNSKQNKDKVRSKFVPSAPFLIAQSCSHAPKLEICQKIDYYSNRQNFSNHIKSKFPRKKVKSAFKSEYRPWSPLKNSEINDYIYQ